MKKIKSKATLGEDWEPILRELYLVKRNPDLLATIDPESAYPFYLKLLKPPFQNWVLEISSFDESTSSFTMNVDLVPKEITEQEQKKLQKKLKDLSSNIVNAILCEAIEETEKQKTS